MSIFAIKHELHDKVIKFPLAIFLAVLPREHTEHLSDPVVAKKSWQTKMDPFFNFFLQNEKKIKILQIGNCRKRFVDPNTGLKTTCFKRELEVVLLLLSFVFFFFFQR